MQGKTCNRTGPNPADETYSGILHLWQQASPQEDWEGLAARVGLLGLQDLAASVFQEVMQPVGAPVPKQRLPVIPQAEEAQHLHRAFLAASRPAFMCW